jgi:hypothetical protein
MKTNRKNKTLTVVENNLSTPVKDKFIDFIDQHPARRVSLNLRRMLLEFLMTEHGVEAMYLNDLLYDLDALFELLEVIQTENESNQ